MLIGIQFDNIVRVPLYSLGIFGHFHQIHDARAAVIGALHPDVARSDPIP